MVRGGLRAAVRGTEDSETVWHLRPETLEFLDRAPLRLSFAAQLEAPPDAVFRELAERPDSWPCWFPGFASAAYVGDPPYGTGTARRLQLVGGVRALETVLVWDPARCFVYRVEEAGVPGVRAMMEEWRPARSPYGGTMLHWTIALDVWQPVRAVWRAADPLPDRAFRRAARRLEARIASAAADG
ncbi:MULTISPECIES: SRPBCC family protein [unclassified Streptomyces]|uniref:SRPBCC family protein n=1 Tax=unclassified Streptomyces TaxID=2593676 RepID=UPI0034398385